MASAQQPHIEMSSSSAHSVQGYSSFYKHIASYPEIGIFRRFGAHWAKKVHDDTSEVHARLEVLESELEKWPELETKAFLDCPLKIVKEKCPKGRRNGGDKYGRLMRAWKQYELALMRHGETLCLSEKIMKLPVQHTFSNKQLAEWKSPDFKPLFNDDEFVPTGEDAGRYQGNLEETDTCAWHALPFSDVLSAWLVRSSPWIEHLVYHVVRRWQAVVHKKRTADRQKAVSIQGSSIIGIVDTVSCLVASILLTATVAVLAYVRPLWLRILFVGLFGTFFPLLLKLMAGKLTRGEVFAATAAFYAVAAVFVGVTSNDCVCA